MAVEKVKGEENPADLMTKFLGKVEVEERLRRMRVEVKWQTPMSHPQAGDRKVAGDEDEEDERGGRVAKE